MREYSIANLDDAAETLRHHAAATLSPEYNAQSLDNFITIEQTKSLIADSSLYVNDDGELVINEQLFEDMFDNVRDFIYQSALSKLASSGHIECAWDANNNKMSFWLESKKKGKVDISSTPDYDS